MAEPTAARQPPATTSPNTTHIMRQSRTDQPGRVVDAAILTPMDTYEGAARLEWWANRDTCLGAVDVRVLIVSSDAGWHASAAFASPLTAEDREAWTFLMTLAPNLTLRFEGDDDAAIDVRVDEPHEGELTLTAV